LLLAKVYGYPVLDSLNLWGGIILSILLVVRLVKEEWAYREPPKDLASLVPDKLPVN